MKLFVCFGGAAPVADDEAAEVEARRRAKRAGRRLPSFRWRRFFFPGKLQGKNKKKKRPSPSSSLPPAAAEAKKRGTDMDDSVGGVFGAFASSSSSSSRLSSASSSSSLYSYSSAPSTPARSSAASCSPTTVSGALSPAPPAKAKGSSPAAGAAAVVLCLLMVVFCGRVGATLLTPTALYLFPRRWPAKARRDGSPDHSLQCDAEEETAMRNRKSN